MKNKRFLLVYLKICFVIFIASAFMSLLNVYLWDIFNLNVFSLIPNYVTTFVLVFILPVYPVLLLSGLFFSQTFILYLFPIILLYLVIKMIESMGRKVLFEKFLILFALLVHVAELIKLYAFLDQFHMFFFPIFTKYIPYYINMSFSWVTLNLNYLPHLLIDMLINFACWGVVYFIYKNEVYKGKLEALFNVMNTKVAKISIYIFLSLISFTIITHSIDSVFDIYSVFSRFDSSMLLPTTRIGEYLRLRSSYGPLYLNTIFNLFSLVSVPILFLLGRNVLNFVKQRTLKAKKKGLLSYRLLILYLSLILVISVSQNLIDPRVVFSDLISGYLIGYVLILFVLILIERFLNKRVANNSAK